MKGSFLLFFVCIGAVSLAALNADAATLRKATADDCKRIQERNASVECIPGTTPFSDIDTQQTGGKCDFPVDPKEYLKTKTDKPASHINGLAEGFACCVAKFIKAGEASGHNIQIFSGYRSIAHQTRLWNDALKKYGSASIARKHVAFPGNSRHNHGIAADLRSIPGGVFKKSARGACITSACRWAHLNAERFGLYFRMHWEPWHIEPQTSACKAGGSGNVGNTDIASQYNSDGSSSSTGQSLGSNQSLLSSLNPNNTSGGSFGGGGASSVYIPDEVFQVNDGEGDALEYLYKDYGGDLDISLDEPVESPDEEGITQNSLVQQRDQADIQAQCEGGTISTNIYGNLVCVREGEPDVTITTVSTLNAEGLTNFTNTETSGVTRAIASLANQVLPIYHLVDGTSSQRPGETYLFGGRTQDSYDAFQPPEWVAQGANPDAPITGNDFFNWLIADEDEDTSSSNSIVTQLVFDVARPAAFQTSLLLFGAGAYSVDALLELSQRI